MGYVSFLEGNYRDLIWGTPSITENLRFGAKIFHTEGVGGLVLHGSRSPRVDEVPLKKITFCIHLAVVVSMCYFLGRNGVHHNHRKSHEKNGDTAGFSNFWGLFQVIMAFTPSIAGVGRQWWRGSNPAWADVVDVETPSMLHQLGWLNHWNYWWK